MKICGLYGIRNTLCGKSYIGSSCDVKRRFNDHRHHLRRGNHANPKLQAAWNLHGEGSFVFEVLLECPRKALLQEEKRLIELMDAVVSGYNCKDYTTGLTAEEFTPSRRERLSLAARNRELPSLETRKLLSEIRMGHPVSQRSIDSLIQRNKARAGESRPEAIARLAKHNTGSHRTQETRERQAEARRMWWARKKSEKELTA